MFTTTAVVLTIGIARWVEGHTQDVKLVAFSGAILIMLGVIGIELPEVNADTMRSLGPLDHGRASKPTRRACTHSAQP